MFTLCQRCAVIQSVKDTQFNNDLCTHADDERCIKDTFGQFEVM